MTDHSVDLEILRAPARTKLPIGNLSTTSPSASKYLSSASHLALKSGGFLPFMYSRKSAALIAMVETLLFSKN